MTGHESDRRLNDDGNEIQTAGQLALSSESTLTQTRTGMDSAELSETSGSEPYLEDKRLQVGDLDSESPSLNNDAKEDSSESEPARDHSASLLPIQHEYLVRRSRAAFQVQDAFPNLYSKTFGFDGELGAILVPLTASGAEDLQHLAQARLKSALSEQRVLNIRLHDAEQYLVLFKAEETMIQRRIDTAARDVARAKEMFNIMLEAAGL
uniref:Uncharacterized protein n=1 Tax=Mycena chlorophos TaxID=658473 RepID=A0ABQ0LVP5_MYCCL|nr:predicted protein [Mycena chlorophos]